MRNLKNILILFSILVSHTFAQTCCTSGTPILSSLEMSVANKNILQINLSYNYNILQDILDTDIKLNDNTRERLTQSIILELNYGFTKYFTLAALFTYVKQSRTIKPIEGLQNNLHVLGISDIVILGKYNLIQQNILSKNDLTLGLGIKIPAGKFDVKEDNILVPADLQPGTGSWDEIFWAYYSRAKIFSSPLNFIFNLSYKLNGSSKRFGKQFGSYKFGNEFISTFGFVYFTNSVFTPTLFLRLRNTAHDEFSNEKIPNTGGWWLNLIAGGNVAVYKNLTFRISGQIPLYTYLNGVQLTTTFVGSASIILRINTGSSLGI